MKIQGLKMKLPMILCRGVHRNSSCVSHPTALRHRRLYIILRRFSCLSENRFTNRKQGHRFNRLKQHRSGNCSIDSLTEAQIHRTGERRCYGGADVPSAEARPVLRLLLLRSSRSAYSVWAFLFSINWIRTILISKFLILNCWEMCSMSWLKPCYMEYCVGLDTHSTEIYDHLFNLLYRLWFRCETNWLLNKANIFWRISEHFSIIL